jgi:hypothetical protein
MKHTNPTNSKRSEEMREEKKEGDSERKTEREERQKRREEKSLFHAKRVNVLSCKKRREKANAVSARSQPQTPGRSLPHSHDAPASAFWISLRPAGAC